MDGIVNDDNGNIALRVAILEFRIIYGLKGELTARAYFSVFRV